MYITRVTLNNYRNYGSLGLELSPGLNVFTGENAQGKTNLLEAVYFTGVGRSMRTPRDKELIRWGDDMARIRADAAGRYGKSRVEIVLDKRAEGDDQFYDFDSKYMDAAASHVEVPANLPEETLNLVRETAKKAFVAVDGAGLSRVDTFVTKDGKVMVNEINTMPGFTSISMYPKAWEATGVRYTDLITMLIEGVLR